MIALVQGLLGFAVDAAVNTVFAFSLLENVLQFLLTGGNAAGVLAESAKSLASTGVRWAE